MIETDPRRGNKGPLTDDSPDSVLDARDRETEREALAGAIRGSAQALVVGIVGLVLTVYGMRATLSAADANLQSGEFWYYSSMPAVIFAFVGGLIGGFSGWRMLNCGALASGRTWLVGAAGLGVCVIVAGITGVFIFEQNVPTMFWVSLAAALGVGLVGITYFTVWAA